MDRVLEPELMDDAQRAAAYSKADFSRSNQHFVNQFLSDYPTLTGSAIDIGTGPGDVMIRLAKASPELAITAVDGSEAMIRIAEREVRLQGFERRITLLCARIPDLPLTPFTFDAILSKDLLHHLPDPSMLWTEARRLVKPGGVICVMDLFRPETLGEVKSLVQKVTGKEDPIVQEDFFNSLCAAFTMGEVSDQLGHAGLKLTVGKLGDRHILIRGRVS